MSHYRLTTWAGAYYSHGVFSTFSAALAAYRVLDDSTKQLINDDLAECGRDGLTDDERDQVAAVAYAEEQAAKGAA